MAEKGPRDEARDQMMKIVMDELPVVSGLY